MNRDGNVNKPEPLPRVYDWNELSTWLRMACPCAARELATHLGKTSNGALVGVELGEHEKGYYEDHSLPAESIAFLRREIGESFQLWVWW